MASEEDLVQLLSTMFVQADKDGNGVLDKKEFKRLLLVSIGTVVIPNLCWITLSKPYSLVFNQSHRLHRMRILDCQKRISNCFTPRFGIPESFHRLFCR